MVSRYSKKIPCLTANSMPVSCADSLASRNECFSPTSGNRREGPASEGPSLYMLKCGKEVDAEDRRSEGTYGEFGERCSGRAARGEIGRRVRNLAVVTGPYLERVARALEDQGLTGPAFDGESIAEALDGWRESGEQLDRLVASAPDGDPISFVPDWQ